MATVIGGSHENLVVSGTQQAQAWPEVGVQSDPAEGWGSSFSHDSTQPPQADASSSKGEVVEAFPPLTERPRTSSSTYNNSTGLRGGRGGRWHRGASNMHASNPRLRDSSLTFSEASSVSGTRKPHPNGAARGRGKARRRTKESRDGGGYRAGAVPSGDDVAHRPAITGGVKLPLDAETYAAGENFAKQQEDQNLSNMDQVDVASDQADAGDANATRLKLNQTTGDLSLDIRDFNGGWAPAPVDWDDRTQYRDPNLKSRVLTWADGHDFDLENYLDPQSFSDGEQVNVPPRFVSKPKTPEFLDALGELCPHEWMPIEIEVEGEPFNSWWQRQLQSPPERELVKDDDDFTKPFWERYTGWHHDQLSQLKVPDARIDQSDNDMVKYNKGSSHNAMLTVGNSKQLKIERAKRDKKERLRMEHERLCYVPPPNPHSPKVNLYVRPAEMRDVPQLLEIWNHYMENTVYDPKTSGLQADEVGERLTDIREAKLPFLVAVDRSARRARGPRFSGNQGPERLLGFAYADDFNDSDGMYRYTVEIDVFVRPEVLNKGVGRTLLDRLVSVLDPDYVPKGGYEWTCSPDDEFKYASGGQRVLEWIFVWIPHESNDKARRVWMTDWLKRFNFEEKGYMVDMGRKLGKK